MNKPKTFNKPKKFVCIAKVGAEKFVKYRCNDLVKFAAFLDRAWTGWRWVNVYCNRGKLKGVQVSNFTKKNRPI